MYILKAFALWQVIRFALAAPSGTIQVQLASNTNEEYHLYANPDQEAWAAGGTQEYSIHSSCNSSQTSVLRRALRESEQLASHAKDHVLRWGNESDVYRRYFGNAPTAEVIGWFEKLVNADKTGVLLRCDDADGRCAANPTYGGYWRGAGAPNENNICDLSFTTRRWLDTICMSGYTIAGNTSYSIFWAADLHHRFLHTPKVSELIVDHYADGFQNITALATERPEEAVRNTHSLTHFALDAYAHDIAVPGEGCTGTAPRASSEGGSGASSGTSAAVSSPSSPASAQSTTASTLTQQTVSKTASASGNCHTHADGEVHCV